MEDFIFFLLALLVLGAVAREDFVFTLVYLFAGVYVLGNLWNKKALGSLQYKRSFTSRAFLDEEVPVRVKITNSGILPVVWLRIFESMPVELSIRSSHQEVLTLGPHSDAGFNYQLKARKRGLYRIGPMFASSGDLLGLLGETRIEISPDYLTVYPKIVPLRQVDLPSSSPMGTLRYHQPIFEDPTRVLSKRDYVAGDSLRRIDWKASASVGRLQVKQFEPSIALETAIFLNLNYNEYDLMTRIDSMELAIIVAASMANWISRKKQSVGLYTNGVDPIGPDGHLLDLPARALSSMRPLPPRKGSAQLMQILDMLARVQAGEAAPTADLLRQEYNNLPWGTTILLVTEKIDDPMFDLLFQIRRSGLNIVNLLVSYGRKPQDIQRRLERFNLPVYFIHSEDDLDIWRK